MDMNNNNNDDNNKERYQKEKPEVVSLFSGCGGSSLGYKMAGFKVLLANEFVPAARETYQANFPGTRIIDDDIRKVKGSDILKIIGKKKGQLHLLDGSPPCSSFSRAGRREHGWGKIKEYSDGIKQRTDDLYFEYIRLLSEIKPRVFLAENVPGLTVGTSKGYFNEIFLGMQKAGYKVKASILNAANYGVPQARRRLFFLGVRKDLEIEPTFPVPTHSDSNTKTVGDVIVGIKNTETELQQAKKFVISEDSPTYRLLTKTKPGQSFKENNREGNYFTFVRTSFLKPSPTVLANRCQLFHPLENRSFTITELKRICSFPDDFILTGTYTQQWERLGRAVPPLLMKAVALHIKENILS